MRSSLQRAPARHVALSAGQEGLWFASRLDAHAAAAYDMVFAFEAAGEIDTALLESALDVLQDRHEVLRAHVESGGGSPRLVVAPAGSAVRVRVSHCVDSLDVAAHAAAGRAVDPGAAPLLHVTQVRPSDGSPAGLLFQIPHLVFDGPSSDRFFTELGEVAAEIAAGKCPPRTGHDGALAAYVASESAWLRSTEGHVAVEGVRARIAGAVPRLALPGIQPASRALHASEARVLEFPIDPEGLARVSALARARRATPAAVWLAAFELAVWRGSGQGDFIVTLPVSQRDRADNESALGYFTNLGVSRARVDEALTGAAFVDRVADDLLETLEARAVPFRLVGSPRRAGARGPAPAFSQLGFNYERLTTGQVFHLGPCTLKKHEGPPRWAKEELKLDVLETPDGARGWLIAERGACEDAALEDIAHALFEVLEALLEDPSAPLSRLGVGTPAATA